MKAHNPRNDGTEVADNQIVIGNLNEEGLMDVNRETFQEGRSEKPELQDHYIDPVVRDRDYSENVGYDPVITVRDIRKQADAARVVTLIDGAISIIYKDNPEIPIMNSIDLFLKDYDDKEEEEDDDVEDIEKTNIPPASTPKDSVAELSSTERK